MYAELSIARRIALGLPNVNVMNPKYLEWYSPYLGLEHTIQVSKVNRVNRFNKEVEDN